MFHSSRTTSFVARALAILWLVAVPASLSAWNTPGVSKLGTTYPKYLWTGAGGNSLWTNGANWCGPYLNGACQGATSGPSTTGGTVVFDGTCVGYGNNCSPTSIPATLTLSGMNINSAFPGTIAFGTSTVTLSSGYYQAGGTVTKTTGNWTINGGRFEFSGGTFNAGSGTLNYNVGNGGVFILSGGSFTATSGLMTMYAETANFSGVVSFTHNSGEILSQGGSNNQSFNPGGTTLYTWQVKACNRAINLQGDVTLAGHLKSTVSGSQSCTTNLNSWSVYLTAGNIYKQSGYLSGSTIIRITGNGQQLLDTTGGNSANHGFPSIVVAQGAAGSVQFSTIAGLRSWDDSATLGTIDPNGKKIELWNGAFNSVALTWPQIFITSPSGSYSAFTNFSVTDLVLSAAATGIGNPTGEIKVYGNVAAGTSTLGVAGGMVVAMVGTGAQNIDLTAATTQYFPFLKINKPSGNLTFTGVPIISGGFNYVTGSYTMPAQVQFGNGTTGANAQITSNGFTFDDVEFVGLNNYTLNDDMNVTGDLTYRLSTAGTMYGPGLLRVTGNISATAGALGHSGSTTSTAIKLVGTNQTLDFSLANSQIRLPGLHFYGSGTQTVTGTFALHTTAIGTIFNHNSGTVDATGSSITFSSSGAPAWTMLMGTAQLGNVTLLDNASHALSGSTMTANGTLTLTEIGSGRSMTGPIDAYGNVSYTVWGIGGNHPITFKGNNSTLSMQTGVSVTTGSLTVAKNAGQKLSLGSDFTMATNTSMAVYSGGVDLNGRNLTISGTGGLTLTGTTLTLSSGTLTIGGSTINPGPYSGGMIDP